MVFRYDRKSDKYQFLRRRIPVEIAPSTTLAEYKNNRKTDQKKYVFPP